MYKKIHAKIRNNPKTIGVLSRLKTAHWMFLVIVLLAGFSLVVIVPPFWGNDEGSHFARTYQLTGGRIKSILVANGAYGGYVPENIAALYNYVSNDLINKPNAEMASQLAQRKDVNQPNGFLSYTSQRRSRQLAPMEFPATAAYSPVAYIPPAIGMTIARVFNVTIGNFFFLSRSTTLLCYSAIVFLALYILRDRKIKWLIFSVALLPNAIIGASIVSADSFVLGLSLLFFSLVMYAFDTTKDAANVQRLKIALTIIAVLLPLTKPAYFPFSFLFLLLPTRLWKSKRSSLTYKIATVGVSMLLLAMWLYVIRNISNAVPIMEGPALATLVNSHQQLLFLWHHITAIPGLFYNTILADDQILTIGTIGIVGWNSALIPTWLAAASFGGLMLAAFYNNKKMPRDNKILLVAALAGLVAVFTIFATFYIAYTPVGASEVIGIQGRYLDPVIVYILAGLPLLIPLRVVMSERATPIIFGCLSAVVAVITVVFYYSILY